MNKYNPESIMESIAPQSNTTVSTTTTPNSSDNEKQKIMKEIELKTELHLLNAYKTGDIALSPIVSKTPLEKEKIQMSERNLINLMQSGADEFEAKMGRRMTYSELRSMFG